MSLEGHRPESESAIDHAPQDSVAYGPEGAFAKFLSWTDEKVRLAEALQIEIDPQFETMLDVGAGEGSITRPLSETVRKVVALEPSGEFTDVPPNVEIHTEKVEDFLARDVNTFDFVLVSHVFIYVPDPSAVLAALNGRVNPGGRLAIVMLEGDSEYQKFVTTFAKDANPALRERSTYKSHHLMAELDAMKVNWRRNLITTSLVAPSIDEFLSINRMHFNRDSALNDDLLQQMRSYLSEHLDDEGSVSLDLQHGIYVVEH